MNLQQRVPAGPTPDPRAERARLTEAFPSARFAETAEVIRPLLIKRLRAFGATPADAEDAAQDALLKAWERSVRYENDQDLLRWCLVVARNFHIDGMRRGNRVVPLTDRQCDMAATEMDAVELRQILALVRAALPTLTPAERRSLTADVSPDRAGQVRVAVARHRARQRLKRAVGPLAAALSASGYLLRKCAPATVTMSAVVAAALLPGLLPPSAVPQPTQAMPPEAAQLDERARPEVQRTIRETRRTTTVQTTRPERTASDAKPEHERRNRVVSIHAPAQSVARVQERDEKAREQLVCLEGNVLPTVCLG